MSEKEVKHIKYLRSLAKKLRKTLDIDKKMAAGNHLQPEQKEILGRRGELLKEISSARRAAEEMQCEVPEQMNKEFEEMLLSNLSSSVKPQIASRNVLEAAHLEYQAEMKAALAGKGPSREAEPLGHLGVPIDWGLGDPKKLIRRGDGASGFERQEPPPNPNDFLVKRA
uniref:Uncharacterized protein n=1 Tax=Hemiselmis andersenii TaxID=464988 RepID=A0A7S1MVD3_HEMAN